MKSSESIALCFPTDGSGYVVALRAFFDASEQGGVFSVAGFAYGLSNANKAQNAWVGAHGKRVVHMADVHAHKEDFENISNVEAGEITVKSIEIISKYMKFGVAASCDLNEMPHTFQIPVTGDRFIDTIAKGFGSPYAWCCHTVMHHIGKMVERAGGGNDEVTCIFETGDRGQGKVKEFVRFVEDQDCPGFRHMYSMNGAQFAEKNGKEILLQSADIFCWEWARHIGRKRRGDGPRKSLSAIFGGFDETPQKYGFTASSHTDNRVIGSHYEGQQWQDGFALLIGEVSTKGKSALVNGYRPVSEGRS